MCDLVAKSGLMWDAPAMAEAVKAREKMHPTALDCGKFALLHPQETPDFVLADSVIAMAISPNPLPFF